MNKLFLSLIATLLFITTINAQQKMDTLSYSLGVLVAQNLKGQGFENLDGASMAQAIDDVLKDNQLKIDINTANQQVQDFLTAQDAKKNGPAIEAGKKFLEDNGKREGVVTLASGLQYEVITEGTGPKPTAADKVTVHYHGMLTDGTVFDSSVDRGEPATFGVTQVIAGWVEALQLMPVGSKWKLFIPYDLAYGPRGAGGQIGPYATLVFEVELIEIAK
jgi:FKBP-type peptidyl-prolyl cis-trans isomerase FklB